MADSAQHWSKIGESGAVIGMKFLLLVYRLTGRFGFRLFLYPVMVYYYLFRGNARRVSKYYLQRIGPLLPPEQRDGLSSFRHFIMFGEILLDKVLVWMGRIRREDVEFNAPELVREVEVERRGGVIVVSHLGNFEVVNAIGQQIPGIRLTILVYTHHAQKFNSLMRGVASGSQVEIMQVTDLSPATVMLFADRVREGGYLVIAGDRTPVTGHERVSDIEFLGATAALPQGPFILAGLLACPVYFLCCLKHDQRYRVYIEKLYDRLEFHPRSQREQILQAAVQRFAGRLQHYCLLAPLQWFNFFPFWRDERQREIGVEP